MGSFCYPSRTNTILQASLPARPNLFHSVLRISSRDSISVLVESAAGKALRGRQLLPNGPLPVRHYINTQHITAVGWSPPRKKYSP